jgi:adenylate cyclase
VADETLSFMARLKRHHIFRVASVYAIAAWVLIQLANSIFPDLGWPRQSVLILIVAVALLFPVVLVLSWMLIPPSKEDPGKYSRWQKLRWRLGSVLTLIIVVFVIISGVFLWRINTRHLVTQKTPANQSVQAANKVLPNSVAVLPFANLSGDASNQYFSDGISEEILNSLSQIPGLNVIGRTSSFQFRGPEVDARKVGELLRVGTLLSGSVQRVGNMVRISAELVNTQSGVQLWSQQYDRKLTNIFAVEDDISNAIVNSLQLKLVVGGSGSTDTGKTGNPEAHRLYLLGLTKIAARGPALREAVEALQQAVKLDPNYAQAWGALAEAELLLPSYNLDTKDDAQSRARAAAQRALSIDGNTSSAYVALGVLYAAHYQWAESDQSFRRALLLAPNDAEVLDQYGQFLLDVGQLEPALREIDRAQQLDPLSGVIGFTRATVLLILHRFDEAEAQINRTIAAYPDSVLAHDVAGIVDIARHRYIQAEIQMRIAAKLSGDDPEVIALLVRGIADPAQRAAAVRSLKPISAMGGQQIVRAFWLAMLDEPDLALVALKMCISRHDCDYQRVLWTPAFDSMRDDPRFRAVLKQMGLPYTPTTIVGVSPPRLEVHDR